MSANKLLEIRNTLSVISKCWQIAEEQIQAGVSGTYPAKNEEFITEYFHGEFSKVLMEASDRKIIGRAFLDDIKQSFADIIVDPTLDKIANGIVADVTLHNKSSEKITGGDLGFQIHRPIIVYSGDFLHINDYRQGILLQAKMRRRNGKWGQFTKNQQTVLQNKIDYLALLLYEYTDEERRLLEPFRWQLCQNHSFENIENWLKTGKFPNLLTAEHIIHGVGRGIIGSDDQDIIDRFISPENNPTLTIRIRWSQNWPPESTIKVKVTRDAQSFEAVRLHYNEVNNT